MNNLIVKDFNGAQVHTFIWSGRACWIANEVVPLFGYADASKAIQDCIAAEDFESGLEYEVLRGEDLKAFKGMVNALTTLKVVSPNTPHLTIFYEDGLYGFLQYTDKPEGIQFRKWIRREVLPEIRQTGAYITSKADPEMLRKKADEIESMTALNEAAKIILPVLVEAGLKPQYRAIALKQIYRKAGMELPIEEMKAERELFDLGSIARGAGIYSTSDIPHGQAVGVIIRQLDIGDSEKELVTFERNGHSGTDTQYTRSVIEKVRDWVVDNGYPAKIAGNSKEYKVIYHD